MSGPSLTVAIAKGRIFSDALRLLTGAGYAIPPGLSDGSRRLVVDTLDGELRLLLVKSSDVPTYVEYGAADCGIAGRDVVAESGRDVLEPLPLGFARCALVVAAPTHRAGAPLQRLTSLRVATKYPRLTRAYFEAQGLSVDIIPLNGSVELAPAAGLADLIVDMVETGTTLRENDLTAVDVVLDSEALLILNRASHKLKMDAIGDLIARLEGASTTAAEIFDER
ncbi:MAG: ATP phosphoribosyltransferase [Anaerolineae bacterium]